VIGRIEVPDQVRQKIWETPAQQKKLDVVAPTIVATTGGISTIVVQVAPAESETLSEK
jgi:hypothetical protein